MAVEKIRECLEWNSIKKQRVDRIETALV